jgi:lipooligosaccharide transport system permease protein
VLAIFGAVVSPLGILIPIALTIGALWVAALSLLITSRIHDINNYNFYMAFVFSYLWISGAYFPLERMPEPVQWLAWAVPLTSAVDISRQLMTGTLSWKMLGETFYLIAAFLITAEFALRGLRRRMVN